MRLPVYIYTYQNYELALFVWPTLSPLHFYQRQTRVMSICHYNECLMVMSSSQIDTFLKSWPVRYNSVI